MTGREHKTIELLGVRVDDVTMNQALARVETCLREGNFHQMATVNPEFIVIAQSHPEFKSALNATALNVPDGVGVLWAARQRNCPLSERIPGQELVDHMAALAVAGHYRIFLLGAGEGIAGRAGAELVRRHPGLILAGCLSGSPSPGDDDAMVMQVNESRADILFVAYGPPKQELWIARNAARLKVRLAMGVGGTFDTLAGVIPRAPQWIRQAGLEWAYRLLREPRRLKRQLSIPYFMWLVLTGK